MKELPLWTPLASLALAMSWLLPNASPPWLAFHKDAWLAGVLLVVLVVWLIRRGRVARDVFRLDAFGGLLLAMGVMTCWQWWVGIVHFSGHASMAVLYFGGAALAIVLGRDWSQADAHQFGDFLFLSLLLAALGTSFLLLVQWLQLPWMGTWIQEVAPTHAPYGNLNQPNNAATLLVLGMVAMGWFSHRRRLGPNIWLMGCAYLSFCVAVTGSRIGYLSLSSLILFAVLVGRGEIAFRPWRGRLLLLLIAFFSALALTHANLGGASDVQSVASPRAFERDLTTARVFLWNAYFATSLSNPWSGFGFAQGFLTQQAAGGLGFDLRGLYTWSHNALLDVATWFGWPMASLVVCLVLWILWRSLRAPSQPDRWIYLAGIYAVVLHGMVELPMAFAYFLLPVCLMTGAVLASLRIPGVSMPRGVVAACTIGLGALLAAVTHDYLRIENAFYTWRFEHARVGKNHPMDVPDTLVLNQFEAMLTGLRGAANSLTRQQVDEFEKAIVHSPSLAAIQHLAEVRMQQADPVGAQRAADMAVLTAKPHVRQAMAARWQYLSQSDPAFGAVQWQVTPGAASVRPD
jgi:hypothetical protein